MKLIVFDSMGQEVKPGEKILSTDGKVATLISATRPNLPGKSGKVYVEWEEDKYRQEYYSDVVFDLTVKNLDEAKI